MTESISCGYKTTPRVAVDNADTRVREALTIERSGALTEIDVAGAFNDTLEARRSWAARRGCRNPPKRVIEPL